MWNKLVIKRVTSGFSIIELLTVMSMMSILAATASPALSLWIPNYYLKSAARDLYSNFQLAKITAVKQNEGCAVVFDSGITPGRYFICSGPGANGNWDGPPAMGGDDVVLKAVNLSNYGNVVDYGSGNSTDDVPGSGSPASDSITYTTPSDIALFTPTGTLINPGAAGSYVYLSNNKGTSYAVGTPNLGGVIVLKKWNGSAWD